jgi:hypothetical protein
MDTRLDEALSKVESAGALVYGRLLQGIIAEAPQERMDFAHFIAVMYVRTPAMRRMVAEIYGRGIQIEDYAYATNPEAFETLVRSYETETGQKLDAATKEAIKQRMIDPSGHSIVLSQEHTFYVLKSAEKLAPLFFDMKWSSCAPTRDFLSPVTIPW